MGQCGPHSSRRPHRGGGNRGPHAGTPSCYPDKRGSPSIFPQPARRYLGKLRCGHAHDGQNGADRTDPKQKHPLDEFGLE